MENEKRFDSAAESLKNEITDEKASSCTDSSAEEEAKESAVNAGDGAETRARIAETAAAVRMNEIPELRGENRKVFRMSDGTEQAVFYAEPIHVFDEASDCFKDADAVLCERDGAFVGGNSRFTAEFSGNSSDGELFCITDGKHRVGVAAVNAGKAKHEPRSAVLFGGETAVSDGSGITAERVVFEKAASGADVEYSLVGNGVKENIVINEKADVYRWSFLLCTENVSAESDGDGKRIAFTDTESGREVFYIPAPFMIDADGNVSENVSYDVVTLENGNVLMAVAADSEWINADGRAFPVTVDPQIRVSGSTSMSTYIWSGGNMSKSVACAVGTSGNPDRADDANRMYIKLEIPSLPRNPRIKKAELTLNQASAAINSDSPKIGLYRVTDDITVGSCTPAAESDLIDYDTMKEGTSGVSYSFDITKLFDAAYSGEFSNANLVLKLPDENTSVSDMVVLYGSTSGKSTAPRLTVTYESGYGVNTAYRTHAHSLGRFGQGSIDLARGNLMFETDDFVWAGNRMPVALRHFYNSSLCDCQYTANSGIGLNTADFSAMKTGNGFRLNIMQSMVPASFVHGGEEYTGYVYIGENGEEIYFNARTQSSDNGDGSAESTLYEDIDGGDMLYNSETRTMTIGEDTYGFDTSGRLVSVTTGPNSMTVGYTSGRITSVTDGAGRVFGFAYNGAGFLASITAPDGTSILYAYSGDLLSEVTYPGGKKAAISYSSDKPVSVVLSDNGITVYKTVYTYSGDRVSGMSEYGFENGTAVPGKSVTYTYSAASRRTVAEAVERSDDGESTDSVIKTVYTFDGDGNVIGEYTDSGSAGNSDASGNGAAGNVGNLFLNHGFETFDYWTVIGDSASASVVCAYPQSESYAKFGKKALRVQTHTEDCTGAGVSQAPAFLAAGDYTFSVYVRVQSAFTGTDDPGVYIRVLSVNGSVIAESERISAVTPGYVRLAVPFNLALKQGPTMQILADGKGVACFDGAQLENSAFAHEYNLLQNGNFEHAAIGWTCGDGVDSTIVDKFAMSRSLVMHGDLDSPRYASQTVNVKTNRTVRETFTLSGWAKGYGIVNRDRENSPAPQFRLRAVLKYYDGQYGEFGTETYTADFSPCTEDWQFASVRFSKGKYRTVQNLTVYCDYDYNFGDAYFDNLSLVRDSFETNLTAGDFTADSTDYGADDDDLSGYEDSGSDGAPEFEEVKDAYGNMLTETTFTDGEFGTLYRSFGFNTDNALIAGDDTGNNLVRETDARGYDTEYSVDSETSRNDEVTDRLGNKTAYEYDASGRITKVTEKKPDGTTAAHVSYSYDSFDNMTGITRGDGMKYVIAYNAFRNLESIGVDGSADKLVTYTYKNGNGRLKKIAYANGDYMTATYNSAGQMTSEKWYDSADTLTAHYRYVYDGQGNIVRSLDILAGIEYTYTYEGGKITRTAEIGITLSDGNIVSRNLISSVFYTYDEEDRLTKKRIIPADGEEQTVYFENSEDEHTAVKFTAGGRTVTSHSKADSFGRKIFDELQLGTGFVSRQFSYHVGEVTDEHIAAGNLKSSPTTQLVSRIVFADGRTIAYEYDAEERITKITDSVDGVTEYTYDALGQLLTEKHDGEVINTMVYDDYGNILSKNGVAYTYGDSVWKDLLTSYGGQPISYDAQGNPTSYLGHTLTWEKGRQLKSFTKSDGTAIAYTYNANGIRTSKTVGGVKHTYMLDGTKVLKEVWGSNTLIPLYDNEDSVCGIVYNGEPYYFVKNLQGDVIAIVDEDVETVAKYSYDAWGVPEVKSDTSEIGIATINPYRYRGYYYDDEIGMYYLQSRYYNPVVGRFVNADDAIIGSLFSYKRFESLFVYCHNNSIERVDAFGYASYSNSYQYISNSKRRVTTKIKFWRTSLTYKYYIDNGVIRFSFADNEYWSVLWRGGAKTLAEAMYKAGKYINSCYLRGRSIVGIHTELFVHWALYTLHIKRSSTAVADMGATYGSYGYDSNAWVFEVGNIISRVAQISIYGLWGWISLLRDLSRYF